MAKTTARKKEEIIADIEKLVAELKAVVASESPKNAESVAKVELVRRYYSAFPGLQPKQYVEAFQNLLGMSKAGARTYYQNAKSEAEAKAIKQKAK